MKTCGLTHKGLFRKRNEDSFLIRELADSSVLMMVADGLGGNPGGDVAAGIIKDVFAGFRLGREAAGEQLLRLVAQAGAGIIAEAEQKPELDGMASTLTAVLVIDNMASWINVGDSRLYLYRDGGLQQVTVDQNLAQFLIAEGELSPKEARISPLRNMLDECVGSPYCEPAAGSFPLAAGDVLLLCTDGVHYGLSPEIMLAIIARETELEKRVEELLGAALELDGKDNITLAALEI